METTISLLERALEKHPLPYWTKQMGLGRTSLASAKHRQHLSPAIAGLLAHLMGEDPVRWVVISALESESGGNGRSTAVAHLKEVAEAVNSEPVKRGELPAAKTTQRGG